VARRYEILERSKKELEDRHARLLAKKLVGTVEF